MKAVVQKLLNFLLFMYLGAIFVLFRSGLDMSLHLRMFLFSSLPLLAMLNGLYKAKLPFREIRKRRFRLAVYGVTIALFLVCGLSWAGILSITRMEGGFTGFKRGVNLGIAYTLFGVLVVNLGLAIRDGNRREKGLSV